VPEGEVNLGFLNGSYWESSRSEINRQGPLGALMRPSRSRQLARAAAGSRHAWWLIVTASSGDHD
jgi:hypothetical protein